MLLCLLCSGNYYVSLFLSNRSLAISFLGSNGLKPRPSQDLIWEWLTIPSQWRIMRSEQEMDQSWLGMSHSGFLTVLYLRSFYSGKNKRTRKSFCLCGILKINIYFIRKKIYKVQKKKKSLIFLFFREGGRERNVDVREKH